MKMDVKKYYDYFLSIITASFGLERIETLLGVILMILSLINILVTLTFQIIKAIKEKKYEQISDALKDATNDVERLRGDINERKDTK